MPQEMEENNVLLLWTMTRDDNEEALAGEATTLNLFSPPPTDTTASENLSQSSIKIKCYCNQKHHHFLDYFNDPILDDAVIYAGDVPFHYNKIEGRYMEFIGNSIGTVFIAAKRDHKFFKTKKE